VCRFVAGGAGDDKDSALAMNAGERIGRFEVLGELGAGGMGQLYRARDPKLGREVAIKVVAGRHSESREHQIRFEQEARAASALNHPNIVTIYDVGEHDGFPYIAMELIEGDSLRTYVAGAQRPLRRLVEVAAQLADGLAVAHQHGIIHRDLKPENVMVTRLGFVKILDFGLAKRVPPPIPFDHTTIDYQVATQAGAVVGTVAYMSPEQARGLPLDQRSDQFALGTILYEMLAGQRPFRGATTVDTLSAILSHQPEDPARLDPRIPRALADLVLRCLAKSPDDRFASTRELADALAAIRDGMSGSRAGAPPADRPLLSTGRARALAATGATLLALAAVGIWLARDRPQESGARSGAARRVAVLPFRDLTGTPAGALIGEGFAETVSARLGADGGVAVLPAAAIDETAGDLPALVQRTGAQAIVRGSLQFEGDRVRATFAVLDPDGRQVSAGSAEGSATRLLDLQDEVARRMAAALGLPPAAASTGAAGAEVESDRYLEALGHLRRYENDASVDAAIRILEELGGSAQVQAALPRSTRARGRSARPAAASSCCSVAPPAPPPSSGRRSRRSRTPSRRSSAWPAHSSSRGWPGKLRLRTAAPSRSSRGGGPRTATSASSSSGRASSRRRPRASARPFVSLPTTRAPSATSALPFSSSAATRRRSRSTSARSPSGPPPRRFRTSGPACSSSAATSGRPASTSAPPRCSPRTPCSGSTSATLCAGAVAAPRERTAAPSSCSRRISR